MTSQPPNHKTLFALMGMQLGAFQANQITPFLATATDEVQLGSELVAAAIIDDSQRQAILAIMHAHLQQHGDNPAVAIKAVLESSPELQSLVHLAEAPDDPQAAIEATFPVRGYGSGLASAGPQDRRFRILRFHDEGGLGQVFEAEDQELQRNVAVKEIQLRFANDTQSRHRFEREARITGALEHPGIVPVYGLGHYEDGRPYYAMRMIRGQSFRDAIREFHSMSAAGRLTGQRVIAQRRLLGQFLDVCNAISYAHQRGVLHRDIKPDNIMLGKYGETLVVDWGLAKRIENPTDSQDPIALPEAPLRLAPEDDQLHTMIGHAVGSPLYMSPEQARGEIDQLGPATDIYSLGATLYTVLTDAAAVEGDSRQEVLANVRQGKTASIWKAKPKVAKPLAAICTKAMEFRPADRYRSVSALTQDIERYLADEPVSAYRETVLERTWRYVRNNRNKVMAAVAATAVLAVTAVAAAMVSQSQAKEELAKSRRMAMFDFVDQLTSSVPRQAGDAGSFSDYLAAVDKRLGRRFLDPDSEGYDPAIHAALTRFISAAYMPSAMYDEAIAFLETHLPVVRAQLGDSIQTTIVMDKLANSYVQVGQPKKAIGIFEDIIRARQALGMSEREIIRPLDNSARAHAAVGNYQTAIALRQRVLELRKTAVPVEETRVASALVNLGLTHLPNESLDPALQLLQEAQEIRQRELSNKNPRTISVQQGIAAVLSAQGKHEQALRMLDELYRTSCDALGADHRTTWRVFEERCRAKLAAGQFAEALADAKSLAKSRSVAFEPGHALWLEAQLLLAQATSATGDPDNAIAMLSAAASAAQYGYATDTNLALAALYLQNDRMREAREAFANVLDELEETYSEQHLSQSEARLGLAEALVALGEFKQAIEVHRQALALDVTRTRPADRARHQIGIAIAAACQGELATATAAQGEAHRTLESSPDAYQGFGLQAAEALILRREGQSAAASAKWDTAQAGLNSLDGPTAGGPAVPPRLRYRPQQLAQLWASANGTGDSL